MSPVATDSGEMAAPALPVGDPPASDPFGVWRYPILTLAALFSGLALWVVIERYGDAVAPPRR